MKNVLLTLLGVSILRSSWSFGTPRAFTGKLKAFDVRQRADFEAQATSLPTDANVVLPSSLRNFQKGDEQKTEDDKTDTSIVSSAAVVAGNMIGAGVLALPSVAGAPGFWLSSGAMVGVWAYCLATGLLIAEVCSGDGRASIQKMTESTLGPVWGNLMCTAFLGSNYLLMVAYICQGATVLSGVPMFAPEVYRPLINKCVSDLHLAPLVFTAFVGGASLWGPSKVIEGANNMLVGMIVISFIGLMGIGLPSVDFGALSTTWDVDTLPSMLPVAVCALVFQNVVPVVSNQLDGNIKNIRTAMTLGSGLPLILYLLWNAVILGHVTPDVTQDNLDLAGTMDVGATSVATSMSPIESLGAGFPELGVLLGTFSFSALVTSFWGASFSLMTECTHLVEKFVPYLPRCANNTSPQPGSGCALGKGLKREIDEGMVKAAAASLVLVPPALVSMACPDAFLKALEYSGIYADPLLYGLIPAVMAWKLRGSNPLHQAQMPGGQVGLGMVAASAIGFMCWQTILRTL
ncbi:unnamed protein product [Discosporangium mesarthrocarpum]